MGEIASPEAFAVGGVAEIASTTPLTDLRDCQGSGKIPEFSTHCLSEEHQTLLRCSKLAMATILDRIEPEIPPECGNAILFGPLEIQLENHRVIPFVKLDSLLLRGHIKADSVFLQLRPDL